MDVREHRSGESARLPDGARDRLIAEALSRLLSGAASCVSARRRRHALRRPRPAASRDADNQEPGDVTMPNRVDPGTLGPGEPTAPEELASGSRVARLGTVSFVRSGFVRVRWDDGLTTDEWAADLVVKDAADHPRTAAPTSA
jgi:hypothetical protein